MVPSHQEAHAQDEYKSPRLPQRAGCGASESSLTFTEALASLVAEALKASAASGLSWAGMVVTVL